MTDGKDRRGDRELTHTRTTICKHCGEASDRGCIPICRECRDYGPPEKNTCENCECEIEDNAWCCERCFGIFDGERFHNELLD